MEGLPVELAWRKAAAVFEAEEELSELLCTRWILLGRRRKGGLQLLDQQVEVSHLGPEVAVLLQQQFVL